MFSRGLLGSVIDMGFTYIRQFQSYCINMYGIIITQILKGWLSFHCSNILGGCYTYIGQFQSYCINMNGIINQIQKGWLMINVDFLSLFQYARRVFYIYWAIPILLYQYEWDNHSDIHGWLSD